MIDSWKNKKVAILGLGVEGIVSAEFLHAKGAKLWIVDKRKKEDLDQDFVTRAEKLSVEYVLGDEYLAELTQFDVIVRSPGVKRLLPELLAAEKAGVTITSQTKLFFDFCPCPIIGVTGTKGKGTTSSLIYEMLKADGRDVYIGGNIGVPSLSFIDKLTKESWVVLELSSFQLQDLHKSPHIGVLLMITSEHLDVHATLEEYISAKRNLIRFQTKDDFAVINRDYPASHESDIETEGQVFKVSRERETDNGCFAVNGKIVVRKNGNDDEVLATDDVKLPGKHNLENICAAVMAARLAGVSKEPIITVLKSFAGLEYRLELIREVNGAKYYNDSFSTTPETAIAAIEAFTQPEILILGGSSKNSDFTGLGITLRDAPNIKAIIGIGEEWERMKTFFPMDSFQFPIIEDKKDMRSIVSAAAMLAKPGDVVILSPACASFDMFKSYKDRGEQFKKAVMALA